MTKWKSIKLPSLGPTQVKIVNQNQNHIPEEMMDISNIINTDRIQASWGLLYPFESPVLSLPHLMDLNRCE